MRVLYAHARAVLARVPGHSGAAQGLDQALDARSGIKGQAPRHPGSAMTVSAVEKLIKLAIKYRCNLTADGVTIVPHPTAFIDPSPAKPMTKQTETEAMALQAQAKDWMESWAKERTGA